MLKKVNVSTFRNALKHYLDQISTNPGTIYQTGNKSDIMVLSKTTLTKLQYRYYVNMWARNQYRSLRLDHYLTLTNGKNTKELPLDVIIGLSQFFQLVQELLDTLAQPGAKENALTWDVSAAIKNAVEAKPLSTHGRFDLVYTILTRLVKPQTFTGTTLNEFFQQMQHVDRMELLPCELTTSQENLICTILTDLSQWVCMLLEYQVLNITDCTQAPEPIFLHIGKILLWYEVNIGDHPNTFGYDPDIENWCKTIYHKTP